MPMPQLLLILAYIILQDIQLSHSPTNLYSNLNDKEGLRNIYLQLISSFMEFDTHDSDDLHEEGPMREFYHVGLIEPYILRS